MCLIKSAGLLLRMCYCSFMLVPYLFVCSLLFVCLFICCLFVYSLGFFIFGILSKKIKNFFRFFKKKKKIKFFSKKTHKWKIVEINLVELSKSRNKKSKIAKLDNILNLGLEVVAHSKTVQNTSKTPKLSISDHISFP